MRIPTAIILTLGIAGIGNAQKPSDIVRTAFENRSILKAARKDFLAAKANQSSQGAYPLTRLEAGSGTRPDVSGGEDLTLFQPLDVFGKSGASRSLGRAGVFQSGAALRQWFLDVQSEALVSYADWSLAVRLESNARDQLAIAQQLYNSTARRVEERSLPEAQLLRSEIDLERQKQVLEDRSASVSAAKERLHQAMGGDRVTLDALHPAEFEASLIKEADLSANRPDLLLSRADLETTSAESRVARLSRFPDLELQSRRSPWASGKEQYGVRLQIVLPLWDHGAGANSERAGKYRLEAAKLRYDEALFRASSDVRASQIELEAATKSVEAYTKLAATAAELMQKAKRGYELGAITLLDVLDARRAYSEALDSLAEAKHARDVAVISRLRSQGQLLEDLK